MSLKQDVKNLVDDVKDGTNEVIHRSKAETERASRDVAGDTLTPGEKVASVAREAKNDVQAGVDRAKREVRHAGD